MRMQACQWHFQTLIKIADTKIFINEAQPKKEKNTYDSIAIGHT